LFDYSDPIYSIESVNLYSLLSEDFHVCIFIQHPILFNLTVHIPKDIPCCAIDYLLYFKELLFVPCRRELIFKIPQDLNFLAICFVAEAAAKMGIILYSCQVLFSLFLNLFFSPKLSKNNPLFLKGTQM